VYVVINGKFFKRNYRANAISFKPETDLFSTDDLEKSAVSCVVSLWVFFVRLSAWDNMLGAINMINAKLQIITLRMFFMTLVLNDKKPANVIESHSGGIDITYRKIFNLGKKATVNFLIN
jgi:hypothetical protein